MPAVALDYDALRGVIKKGPTPLFATVSGAHLYGFPSPDSDVDLRGAFVQPLRSVLRLKTPPETLTVVHVVNEVEIDWVAHDVSKFARMMTRHNGYVLEQVFSPLVVHGDHWLERLREIARGFVIRNIFHHYRGFFWNEKKLLLKPSPTVKELLYAYRVVLTGIHALQTGEIVAHLPSLLEKFDVTGVPELIERKQHGVERLLLDEEDIVAHEPELERLEKMLVAAFNESKLPEEPTTYPELEDFIVRARLELGKDG